MFPPAVMIAVASPQSLWIMLAIVLSRMVLGVWALVRRRRRPARTSHVLLTRE